MIAKVPVPAALKRMIRARQTCFCGEVGAETIASSRFLSEAVTWKAIPVRITNHRIISARWESASGLFCCDQSTRSFHVLEGVTSRLDAAPLRARRRWSAEAKRRLIAASLEPGANVSALAREAGIASSQLFTWRRRAQERGDASVGSSEERLGFVEVTPARAYPVEIDIGSVVLRVGADIGADRLVSLIRAVRSA